MAIGSRKNKTNPYSNPDNYDENGNFIGDSTANLSNSFNLSESDSYTDKDSIPDCYGYVFSDESAGSFSTDASGEYFRKLKWYEKTSSLVIILIAVVLLIAGGIGFFIYRNHKTNADSAAQSTVETAQVQSQTETQYQSAETAQPSTETVENTPIPTAVPTPANASSGISTITTLDQLFETAEAMAAKEADTISLYCSEEIYNRIKSEGSEGVCILNDLLVECGIVSGSWVANDMSREIILQVDQYSAGFRAVHAWQSGDTSGLTDREKQTYDAALLMANELNTGDAFTTAVAIHDRLCETIEYSADSVEADEDDCATGALLNRLANCDGYADAYYLVGTMAGLKVRFQHGDTYEKTAMSTPVNATHVWNLLLLNGSWTHVDVTWDDRDDEMEYEHTWFAVGDDRMQLTHTWNADTTVQTASVTDLSQRPEGEYTVSNETELSDAVNDAMDRMLPQITIFFDNGMSLETDRTFDLLRQAGCKRDLTYCIEERMNCLTIANIC